MIHFRDRLVPWVGVVSALLGCSSDPTPSSGAAGAPSAEAGNGAAGAVQASAGGGVGGAGGAGGAVTTQGGAAGLFAVAGSNAVAGSGAGGGESHFPKLVTKCDAASAQSKADHALAAALVAFWNGDQQYLNAVFPDKGNLTGYWTYAQVFDALLDGVERTGGRRYRGWIRAFYEGRAARGWLVDYYDDEAWMTMALMRAFDLTHEQRYLDTAETIFADIMKQWDTTCCGAHLGGIWWDKKKTQKATASNAGPALAGVRLAQRTGKSMYLDFAKKTYAFWMSDMVEANTFAIYDHLSPNGERAPGALTYNHGLMIGAALELNLATKEAHYLAEAHSFASYMISKATRPSSAGPVLYDGSPCNGDCAAWKGIGYRYLALLFRNDPTHADYETLLTNDANAVWTLARNSNNDLFSSIWSGPAPTTGGVEAQGSAAMALGVYAMLCGDDPTPSTPGVYQAEEGWLDHVNPEANAGRNFIGFGYVSAFTKDKQAFTLDIDVPAAGKYALDFRYTAGEGTCKRSILVNGVAQAEQLEFPATPNWTNWVNARAVADLPAGPSSITVRFESSKGSKTSLDVDQLTVLPL